MLPGHGQLSMGPMSVNDVCVMVPAWSLGSACFAVSDLMVAIFPTENGGFFLPFFFQPC